jgi:hypothetical protein
MERKMLSGRFIAVTVALAVVLVTISSGPASARKKRGQMKGPQFTAQGELVMPQNYRHWIFVGAPVTPNDMNNGKAAFPEFHYVYMDPNSYAAYCKSGAFPDGTMLLKELVSVGSKSAVSGSGYFAGDHIGFAMAVKDSKRYPKEPGHWAYFNFMGENGQALKSAKALPTASCNACHQQNAAEDWVFSQFYPVLREAKKK